MIKSFDKPVVDQLSSSESERLTDLISPIVYELEENNSSISSESTVSSAETSIKSSDDNNFNMKDEDDELNKKKKELIALAINNNINCMKLVKKFHKRYIIVAKSNYVLSLVQCDSTKK